MDSDPFNLREDPVLEVQDLNPGPGNPSKQQNEEVARLKAANEQIQAAANTEDAKQAEEDTKTTEEIPEVKEEAPKPLTADDVEELGYHDILKFHGGLESNIPIKSSYWKKRP